MPRYLPSPISFVCGALLFGLLWLFGAAASAVLPILIALLETSPRLAMLGFLAFATSPAWVVTAAHHFGASRLDAIEKLTPSQKRGALPSIESWAAGAHGWLVLYGTSVLTNLVLLVVEPPTPDSASFGITSIVSALSVHTLSIAAIVWVLIATMFFELQRRSRA